MQVSDDVQSRNRIQRGLFFFLSLFDRVVFMYAAAVDFAT